MVKKKALSPINIPGSKPDDLPASRRYVKLLHDELKHGLEAKIDRAEAGFKASIDLVDIKIDKVEAGLNAKIDKVEAGLNAKIDHLESVVIKSNILVEEQNSNNRIVLEGLQALWERQDRIESQLQSS